MGIYENGKNWFIDYYVHGRREREPAASNAGSTGT